MAAMLAGCAAMAGLLATTGGFRLDAAGLIDLMRGRGDPMAELVVLGLRLPRLVAAVAVGAGLGVGGAVFQSVCRNPLASPDVIGFTTGSATGALVSILVLGQSRLGVAAGAIMGGMLAAAVVYALTARRGLQNERLILVGIGVAALLAACNEYLVTRADLEAALSARTWLYGSLNGVAWRHAAPAAIGVAVLLPCAMLLTPRLRILELGDDLAAGLGLAAASSRVLLLGAAVGLTALATAAAGPVHFLALVAPPLARHACGPHAGGLGPPAAMGALLMLVADFTAQRLFAPLQLPVGLVTSAVGGLYLAYVLHRRQAGGGA